MSTLHTKKLNRLDFPAARSLFRSLFMEGWQETYPIWREAITVGHQEWSFHTKRAFEEIGQELDELLTYPDEDLKAWLPKVCSGLPDGSPDQTLSASDFITEVRDVVKELAGKTS